MTITIHVGSFVLGLFVGYAVIAALFLYIGYAVIAALFLYIAFSERWSSGFGEDGKLVRSMRRRRWKKVKSDEL